MKEYCVCGHLQEDHFIGKITQLDLCMECGWIKDDNAHPFKLDNLRFIEDEAKKRNLI